MGLISSLFGNSVDYKEMIQNGAKVVDVRTAGEFASGNAAGSVNYPLDQLAKHVDDIKKMNAPIVLVCRSGGRAGSAKGLLEKNGIECHNAGAWQNVA